MTRTRRAGDKEAFTAETKYFICNLKREEIVPNWVRSSFNAWEAKNLIGGHKFVVIMSILKHVMWRALQSRNLRSFCINIKFVLVFEFQTLGYKPNPVSCEKISQTFVSDTEKSLGLKVKKYGNGYFIKCSEKQFNWVNNKGHQCCLVVRGFLHMRIRQNSMCSSFEAFLHVLWVWTFCVTYLEWQLIVQAVFPTPSPPLSIVYPVWQVPVSLSCVGVHGWVARICQPWEQSPSRSWLSIVEAPGCLRYSTSN